MTAEILTYFTTASRKAASITCETLHNENIVNPNDIWNKSMVETMTAYDLKIKGL